MPATDECKPLAGDEDECPGGVEEADVCAPPVEADECPGGGANVDDCAPSSDDVCTGGCSGEDQDNGTPVDECINIENDGCALPATDAAE